MQMVDIFYKRHGKNIKLGIFSFMPLSFVTTIHNSGIPPSFVIDDSYLLRLFTFKNLKTYSEFCWKAF